MKEILDSLDRIVDATFERSDKGTYKSLGEILSEEVKKARNQEGNYAKHIN
jgi:hypothetical protein